MSSHLLLMIATTLANTEDHQDLLAFVDMNEELKQESWQLLKLPIRPQTILKLPYRLFPRPLPDVTQLCKLSLPAQPELWLVLSQLQHSHSTDLLYKLTLPMLDLMVHSRYFSDRYRVSSTSLILSIQTETTLHLRRKDDERRK